MVVSGAPAGAGQGPPPPTPVPNSPSRSGPPACGSSGGVSAPAPRHSATQALQELLAGFRQGAGAGTPPLDPDAGGPLRLGEFRTGVGGSDA